MGKRGRKKRALDAPVVLIEERRFRKKRKEKGTGGGKGSGGGGISIRTVYDGRVWGKIENRSGDAAPVLY